VPSRGFDSRSTSENKATLSAGIVGHGWDMPGMALNWTSPARSRMPARSRVGARGPAADAGHFVHNAAGIVSGQLQINAEAHRRLGQAFERECAVWLGAQPWRGHGDPAVPLT